MYTSRIYILSASKSPGSGARYEFMSHVQEPGQVLAVYWADILSKLRGAGRSRFKSYENIYR